MIIMKKEFQANLKRWNEMVGIHMKSRFYDLDGFKNGKNSLLPTEIREVGNVKGKDLLHLQCHFGMDSISWARMGASVTGVDFSDKAIIEAKKLSQELGINNINFVQSNVYDVPDVIIKKYDIVYTSYGTIYWLDDLKKWADAIEFCLKSGGSFYMIDQHPFMDLINENVKDKLEVGYPYFTEGKAFEWEENGDYTDEDRDNPTIFENKLHYGWMHTISEIINSLIETGLRIEYIHEFPFSFHGLHPDLKKGEDGLWRFQTLKVSVPLTLSIKASKPE